MFNIDKLLSILISLNILMNVWVIGNDCWLILLVLLENVNIWYGFSLIWKKLNININ